MSSSDPDFIQRNGAWLLSMLGILATCMSGLMVYMLKSRCRRIRCCGVDCERDVLDLNAMQNVANVSSDTPAATQVSNA